CNSSGSSTRSAVGCWAVSATMCSTASRLSRINIGGVEFLAHDLADALPRHPEVLCQARLETPAPAVARHAALDQHAGGDPHLSGPCQLRLLSDIHVDRHSVPSCERPLPGSCRRCTAICGEQAGMYDPY